MADLTEEDYPGIQPLSNYRGLRYGPNFQPQNRGAQSIGLDGTLQKLRDPELGSPFTFRVRPPATLVNALAGGGGAFFLTSSTFSTGLAGGGAVGGAANASTASTPTL